MSTDADAGTVSGTVPYCTVLFTKIMLFVSVLRKNYERHSLTVEFKNNAARCTADFSCVDFQKCWILDSTIRLLVNTWVVNCLCGKILIDRNMGIRTVLYVAVPILLQLLKKKNRVFFYLSAFIFQPRELYISIYVRR